MKYISIAEQLPIVDRDRAKSGALAMGTSGASESVRRGAGGSRGVAGMGLGGSAHGHEGAAGDHGGVAGDDDPKVCGV